MESKILDNKAKKEVIEILGNNERGNIKSDTFHFGIIEKYRWNIDPEYIKHLEVYFKNDIVFASLCCGKTYQPKHI